MKRREALRVLGPDLGERAVRSSRRVGLGEARVVARLEPDRAPPTISAVSRARASGEHHSAAHVALRGRLGERVRLLAAARR